MRTLLRGSLKRSLSGVGDEDRLAAAWAVVCGPALSERGLISGYTAGIVEIEVVDSVWMRQMIAMKAQLMSELGSIANVPIREVRFVLRGQTSQRLQQA